MAEDALLRCTIVLDKNLAAKLRQMQANKIAKSGKSISFSEVINSELRKSLGVRKTTKRGRKPRGAKK